MLSVGRSSQPASQASGQDHRVLTMPATVLTVGHSTRSLEEFVQLLDTHGVKRLVDVRTVPRSRHNPQFNKDSLPQALKRAGIAYTHMPALGGLRHPRKDSINSAWRNLSFRGFADHMQTAEFKKALQELIALAEKERVCIMCAEAVPWRCHRSLIADALLVRNIHVQEISGLTRTQPHKLTPFAHVFRGEVTYPGLPLAEADGEKESG
ncbi:MAG TPA: DUF488 domain-containing protein [Terriglobales bacterium]|nr:DUF488 domain-containing protein [Terriglobales bacterium]